VSGSRPNEDDFFVILVTDPNFLYRDDGSPQFGRQTVKVEAKTGAIVKKSGNL